MNRTLNVVRLQLINKQMTVWIPLLILASTLVISIAIFAIVPVDAPKYGGASQAPLWYLFALGLTSLTMTFPFSQAMSITRREFFFGTMIAATAFSAILAAALVVVGLIEQATDGWGVNGFIAYQPWTWASGPVGAWLFYFTAAALFYLVGFTGATVYKRWGATTIALISVGLGLVLVGILFLIARFGLWEQTIAFFASIGVVAVALMVFGLAVALAASAFLVLRRATP